MDVASMVLEFHRAFGLPVREEVGFPTFKEESLRVDLLEEEYQEYLEAVDNCDLVAIADALGDMVYVIVGTAITYGIPLNAVLAEVHRSNMSKLGEDGKPIYREDGKVLKSPNYFRPDIERVLQEVSPNYGEAA